MYNIIIIICIPRAMPRMCSMAAAATVAILLLLLTNYACEGGKKIPQPTESEFFRPLL